MFCIETACGNFNSEMTQTNTQYSKWVNFTELQISETDYIDHQLKIWSTYSIDQNSSSRSKEDAILIPGSFMLVRSDKGGKGERAWDRG